MKKVIVLSLFAVAACTSQNSNVGGGGSAPSQHLATELQGLVSSGSAVASSSAAPTGSVVPASSVAPTALPSGSAAPSGSTTLNSLPQEGQYCYACLDPKDQGPQTELAMNSSCGCGCSQNYYSEDEQMCLDVRMSICEASHAGFSSGSGGACYSN